MNHNNQRSGIRRSWSMLLKLKIGIAVAVAAIVVVAVAYLVKACSGNTVQVVVNDNIDATPLQVIAMKRIGQWEFLSVDDEEMVDTVRKGFFSDDYLTRIYYGTLRIGIDLAKTKADWVRLKGDTVVVDMPPVALLDSNFIDEARTQSFFETGKWTDQDRANLYRRAVDRMHQRCLTPENMASAENNAQRQLYSMLRAMGYKNIVIRPAKK